MLGFFDMLFFDTYSAKPHKNWLVPRNRQKLEVYNGTGLLVWLTILDLLFVACRQPSITVQDQHTCHVPPVNATVALYHQHTGWPKKPVRVHFC